MTVCKLENVNICLDLYQLSIQLSTPNKYNNILNLLFLKKYFDENIFLKNAFDTETHQTSSLVG